MPYFSKKACLGSDHHCYHGLLVSPSKSAMPTSSLPSGFCSPVISDAAGSSFTMSDAQGPSSFGWLFRRLLLDYATLVSLFQLLCTPSLNSDAGGSEQLERTLEYGTIHQQPLEGRTSRSQKPPKPGSLCTGSESRWGLGVGVEGEVPLARQEFPLCKYQSIQLLAYPPHSSGW